MKKKYCLLFVFLTFAVFKSINSFGINALDDLDIQDNTGKDTTSYIIKEIKYYAPKSGAVMLAWYVENYQLSEAVLWNTNTRVINELLYTPFSAKNDTFFIRLKVPEGTVLQYNYWITKSKQGHYQDFWDLNSSGKTVVNNSEPIVKRADYSKKETVRYGVTDKGWILFLFLLGILAMLLFIGKKWLKNSRQVTYFQRILLWGISLALFQFLARADIIGANPLRTFHDHGIPLKIIKASWQDFKYVFLLVAFFEVLFLIIRNKKARKVIYALFIGSVIISSLSAFSNITTIKFLGKPFNYQWLYYSDFLGSEEAKTAIQENLSIVSALNIVLLCISVWILAIILIRIYQLLLLKKYALPVVYILLIMFVAGIGYKSIHAKVTWTNGQSENPVTSMIVSIITINSNSSFFSSKIPDDMAAFHPAEGIQFHSPILIEDNTQVKNILFIVLESAGAVYFDAYGGNHNLSPNLNKYASQALRFENAYAHAPATNRSLVSILGSIYPYLSYKSLTQEYPDIDHPTISSILKSKGYRTSFFSSANLDFQNCREFLSNRDFDRVEDFSTIDCGEKFQLDSDDYKEGNGIDDLCLADILSSWIDEDTTKHFFSMIWTVQGHYPYFFAGKEDNYGVNDFSYNRYLNALKHNDDLIGRVMTDLEARELDKSTLVVVIGDHGEAFGQHQQYGHGTKLYEENLKVPLYFINSTLFHGEQKNDIAGMKDLSATSLSIINIEVPESWQGRNLLNSVSDEAFYFAPWSDYLFGYRKDNMKFIFNETRNTFEVFDLSQDAQEKKNLANDISDEEIENARNRISVWVQFQDHFIKQLSSD